MLKTSLLALILNFSNIAFAQEKQTWTGKILSNENPVSFATVVVLPSQKVFTAEEDGSVIFDYIESDSVKFSCLGYRSMAFAGKDLVKISEIKLRQVVFQIDEVKITSKQNTEWWGMKGEKSTMGWGFSPGSQAALFIPNLEKKSGTITKLRYFLSGFIFSKAHRIPFNIKVLTVGQDGSPDKDLIPETVMVQSKKRKWFEVDISQYNIPIPENGFFVCMDFLPKSQYEYEYRNTTFVDKDKNRTKGKSIITLSVGSTKELNELNSYFRLGRGSWIKDNQAFNSNEIRNGRNFLMGAEVKY